MILVSFVRRIRKEEHVVPHRSFLLLLYPRVGRRRFHRFSILLHNLKRDDVECSSSKSNCKTRNTNEHHKPIRITILTATAGRLGSLFFVHLTHVRICSSTVLHETGNKIKEKSKRNERNEFIVIRESTDAIGRSGGTGYVSLSFSLFPVLVVAYSPPVYFVGVVSFVCLLSFIFLFVIYHLYVSNIGTDCSVLTACYLFIYLFVWCVCVPVCLRVCSSTVTRSERTTRIHVGGESGTTIGAERNTHRVFPPHGWIQSIVGRTAVGVLLEIPKRNLR